MCVNKKAFMQMPKPQMDTWNVIHSECNDPTPEKTKLPLYPNSIPVNQLEGVVRQGIVSDMAVHSNGLAVRSTELAVWCLGVRWCKDVATVRWKRGGRTEEITKMSYGGIEVMSSDKVASRRV